MTNRARCYISGLMLPSDFVVFFLLLSRSRDLWRVGVFAVFVNERLQSAALFDGFDQIRGGVAGGNEVSAFANLSP